MNYPTVAGNASRKGFFSGRARGRGILLGLGLLLAPASLSAAPRVELSDGAVAKSQLTVGDDLYVSLAGVDPSAVYGLRLLGSDGEAVAALSARTDAFGNLAPQLLWARSGVVGCDCGAPEANPSQHVFANYAEAEEELSGKGFEVQVMAASGVEVARLALPVVAAAKEIAYFADADGCPRSFAKASEALYLAILHPERAKPDRRFFMALSKPWPLGEPIADVRGALQAIAVPATGGDLEIVPLAGWPLAAPTAASSRIISYDGVWRQGLISHPWIHAGDQVMAAPNKTPTGPEGNGGIVITMDGCTPAAGVPGGGH